MRDVLILLIGLIAGALLQALTSWLTDKRAAKREHDACIREKRYEAYTALLAVVSEMNYLPSRMAKARRVELYLNLLMTEAKVQAIGTPDVLKATNRVTSNAAEWALENAHELPGSLGALTRAISRSLTKDGPKGSLKTGKTPAKSGQD